MDLAIFGIYFNLESPVAPGTGPRCLDASPGGDGTVSSHKTGDSFQKRHSARARFVHVHARVAAQPQGPARAELRGGGRVSFD